MMKLYPPRATSAVPPKDDQLFKDMEWIAQLKYNDTHILVDNTLKISNRQCIKANYYPPEEITTQLEQIMDALGADEILLDGGLLHNKHSAIKHTIVLWDILVHGEHLLETTYLHRYNILRNIATELDGTPYTFKGHNIGTKILPDIILPNNILPEDWDDTWDIIHDINEDYEHPLLEGLMLKDPNGVLEHGISKKNNSEWMVRSRVATGRHMF